MCIIYGENEVRKMSDYRSRILEYKSSPALSVTSTESRMSEDSQDMDWNDADYDDFGFKSLPEYAMRQIFYEPVQPLGRTRLSLASSVRDTHRTIPTIVMTPDSPATVRKKRRAPEPPSGLTLARTKYPSSDNIVDMVEKKNKKKPISGSQTLRPKSMSPGRLKADLFDELIEKLHAKSPSPASSPRQTRAKALLSKLRSPRIPHKGTRRKRTTSKEEEEAGFKSPASSVASSFDEPDGPMEDIMYFGVLAMVLERDVEFEVGCFT